MISADDFVRRLGIIDTEGRVSNLMNPHPEQVAIWDALNGPDEYVCILKPRQIGCTTATTAWMFWKGFTCPDPIGLLSITHESGAVGRVNQMLRNYWRTLPAAIRPELLPDNAKEIGFTHNGATYRQLMAGGRGQGRSFTYQVFHATEMGLWPKGSAVKEGSNIDQDVWASTLSTMHKGPHFKVIVESTGDGPGGIFHKVVQTARREPGWAFLFFPWTDFEEYRRELPPDWVRTTSEDQLADEFGLEDEQLAWRRWKMATEGYDELRFKREYPLTWLEPFLGASGMWFDVEHLNRVAGLLPALRSSTRELNIFREYEVSHTYYIGMDSSGGTGGDYAVIQVLRDDLEQVAVWRSNKHKPHRQADVAAQLSVRYGRAKVLCEQNHYGEAVIKQLGKLGVRLWKSPKGKDFWTQGGPAGRTKKMIYDWAAQMIDGDFVGLCDPTTVAELTTIRETDSGNIEADGDGHDDHADALALALWNARSARATTPRKRLTTHQVRKARHKNPLVIPR